MRLRNWIAAALWLALAACSPPLPAAGMSLQDAISLALERNAALSVERGKIAEAEADYHGARAGLLPRVSLSAYHNQLNDDRLSPSGVTLPGARLFTRESFAGLLARQVLFDGGRTESARQAAARGLEAQQIGYGSAREDTAYQVAQAYYRVLEARALVRVAEASLTRQREFEKLTGVLFSAGKATRLDGMKAEAQAADAERTHERAREAERLALVWLRRVIGLPMEEPVDPTDVLPAAIAAPRDERELAKLALQANPDLKRLDRQIDQARDNRSAARAARLPEFSLQGSYGYRERDLGGGAPEWTLGVVAAWTVYDGGATASQTAKAIARLAQLEESRQAARLALEADVRDAAGAWRGSRADADAAGRLHAANEEALKAALALYASGKATALDVLSAHADVARAEGTRAQALAALAIARVRLARLTGVKDASQLEQKP